MKRITQLVVCWMIVFISGCTPVAKLFYGVKHPGFETESSINEFVTEIGMPKVPMFCQKFESWETGAMLHSPDVFVFSKDGRYIPYKDSLKPNCTGPAELFLSELNTKNTYFYSDEFSYLNFYSNLNTPNCMSARMIENGEVDFYIFTTFAKWQGKKFLTNKTLVWLDSLKQNTNIKYELILVNTDFQDCWSASQKARFEKKK